MKATSPYLNRPPRSYEHYLIARLARSIQHGWRYDAIEQTLAELDRIVQVVKPRRSLTSNGEG